MHCALTTHFFLPRSCEYLSLYKNGKVSNNTCTFRQLGRCATDTSPENNESYHPRETPHFEPIDMVENMVAGIGSSWVH